LGDVIKIDDERIKNHLDRVVRGSVEETLSPDLASAIARDGGTIKISRAARSCS
jgi:hypothetical protein